MTPEHLRQLIASEVERADQALRAAETLHQAHLSYDAASRAYYSVFHYARALCFAIGEEPRSHHGVAHLLSLRFVRAGLLPTEVSRLYAGLQRFREDADYNTSFVLDAAGTAQVIADARALVEHARAWLVAQGLL